MNTTNLSLLLHLKKYLPFIKNTNTQQSAIVKEKRNPHHYFVKVYQSSTQITKAYPSGNTYKVATRQQHYYQMYTIKQTCYELLSTRCTLLHLEDCC